MLWYFAYGSNLSRAIFAERRGMRPAAALPARLDGWALVFDLPVGPGERAVANLAPDPAAHTWGACYLLEPPACEVLDRSEGVHVGWYARLPVQVVTPAGNRVAAFSYRSGAGVAGRKPSARYRGLLVTGAQEHGLPDEWIRHLEALDLAVDERLATASTLT